MDELELLKKDWNKIDNDYPDLSFDEIYKMTHAKSSSIVKWIFYISLIELGIGLLLTIINPSTEDHIEYPKWIEVLNYLSIPILIYFICLFYKNYKTITTTDNVRKLIKSILNTRKTVKYYVLFNLIMVSIVSAVGIYLGYMQSAGGLAEFNETAHFKEYALLCVIIVGFTSVFIAAVYGIYYLLYGILLKRLNRNYDELKKLEV